MKTKRQYIQVFLTGDAACEINGELKFLDKTPTYLDIIWKEQDEEFRHLIPVAQIRFVRTWHE